MNSNLDCMFLHSPLDQYCNLFKGYKHCDKTECKVLDLLQENEQLQQKWLQSEYEKSKLVSQNEKMKSKVSVELDYESLRGLHAILAIFKDRVCELENLERTDLHHLYSIAKYIQRKFGCEICKHYGKERDCRGCIKCCNGTCCNLELAE